MLAVFRREEDVKAFLPEREALERVLEELNTRWYADNVEFSKLEELERAGEFEVDFRARSQHGPGALVIPEAEGSTCYHVDCDFADQLTSAFEHCMMVTPHFDYRGSYVLYPHMLRDDEIHYGANSVPFSKACTCARFPHLRHEFFRGLLVALPRNVNCGEWLEDLEPWHPDAAPGLPDS